MRCEMCCERRGRRERCSCLERSTDMCVCGETKGRLSTSRRADVGDGGGHRMALRGASTNCPDPQESSLRANNLRPSDDDVRRRTLQSMPAAYAKLSVINEGRTQWSAVEGVLARRTAGSAMIHTPPFARVGDRGPIHHRRWRRISTMPCPPPAGPAPRSHAPGAPRARQRRTLQRLLAACAHQDTAEPSRRHRRPTTLTHPVAAAPTAAIPPAIEPEPAHCLCHTRHAAA